MPGSVRKRSPLKLFPFAALIVLSMVAISSAQDADCFVHLVIAPFAKINGSPKAVTGIQARLVDLKAKDELLPVVKAGTTYFNNVPSGSYRLRLTRDGYKEVIEDFSIGCSTMISGESYSHPVEMFSIDPVTEALKPAAQKETAGSNAESNGRPVGRPISVDLAETIPASAVPPGTFISKGVLNYDALFIARPSYPPTARAVGAKGIVIVQIYVDESGNVIDAMATSGHLLLRAACVKAAKASRIRPVLIDGKPVKISGVLVFSFA